VQEEELLVEHGAKLRTCNWNKEGAAGALIEVMVHFIQWRAAGFSWRRVEYLLLIVVDREEKVANVGRSWAVCFNGGLLDVHGVVELCCCSQCGRATGAGMLESHGSCARRSCTARGRKPTPLDFGLVVAAVYGGEGCSFDWCKENGGAERAGWKCSCDALAVMACGWRKSAGK